MLERWMYISSGDVPEPDATDTIRAIIDISITRNAALGVTGALLFTGRRFAQYLEGPAESIGALRHSIMRDPRHHDIRTVAHGPYDHRRFLTWSLAYAGPSRFVACKVEDALAAALADGDGGADMLADMLADFATDGNG